MSNIHGINLIVDFNTVKIKIQGFSNVQIIYLFIHQNGLFSFTGTLLQFIFALFSNNMHVVLCVLSRWLISGRLFFHWSILRHISFKSFDCLCRYLINCKIQRRLTYTFKYGSFFLSPSFNLLWYGSRLGVLNRTGN